MPGAKVKKDQPGTECYLRHHPNPQMRAPPTHEALMKIRVADSVLQRVNDDAAAGKVSGLLVLSAFLIMAILFESNSNPNSNY